MSLPFDWQPHVVSTQVARVGPLVLACVPGEFTTMAGRRVRAAVQEAAGANSVPILLGLCNTYSDYITTFEEYQVGIVQQTVLTIVRLVRVRRNAWMAIS